ncbi:MAG: tetratricopeptide repeat protein [Bacteroidales bacterium]|nr:tetratricopeptide repeat protein [Bacteroidales bacterium]
MKKIWLFSLVVVTLISCNPTTPHDDERSNMIEKISEMEQQCFSDNTLSYNSKIGLETLKEYQKFVEKYPEDSMSANYLYMGAQLSKSINLYGEAITRYNKLIRMFPEDKRVDKAYFMIGMIYENDIKDIDKAKEAYQVFIEKFPNSDLIDDAKFLIENLGKSDEELLELLKSKSKKDTIA